MLFSGSSHNLDNEESMIYSLVEEIYQNEKKISNINQKQQNNNEREREKRIFGRNFAGIVKKFTGKQKY